MRALLAFVLSLSLFLNLAPLWAQVPPAPINDGQSLSGELNDLQQALQYIFDGQAGENITLTLQTTTGNLNAFLSLATFDGRPIAEDDDSGGGTDALIQISLPESGTYVITASRSRADPTNPTGGAGAFTLSLSLGQLPIPPATPSSGARLEPILRGSPIAGSLSTEARFKLFWFEGGEGETITLSPDLGTSLQPLLVLYNAGFVELFRNQPPAPLAVTLPEAGLYFIGVGLPNLNSSGGNYALTLSSTTSTEAREVQAGQNSLAYGERVRGAISNTSSSFTFQITGRAGDQVTLSMARAGGDLDSYLYLLDAAGVTLAEDDNGGGGNGDARISFIFPQDGTYIALATRQGQATGTTAGSFLLSLDSTATPLPTPAVLSQKPENLVPLPEIELGATVTGEISNGSFLQPYVFQAEAGDELILRLISTSNLDPALFLLNANQEPLAENDDLAEGNQNSEIRYTAPESGYYVAVATRFEGETGQTLGSYELSVARAGQEVSGESPPPLSGSALIGRVDSEVIRPNSTPSGSFSPLQFAQIYRFSISNADSLIDFSVSTDNTTASTILLLDENLQVLQSSDTGSLLGARVPAPGTYAFLIAPAAGPLQPSTEAYILAFNATGEAAAPEENEAEAETAAEAPPSILSIAYGESAEGEITAEVNEVRYRFQAAAGDTIRVRMTAIPPLGLDPLLRVVDENGRVLAENDDIVAGENRDSFLQTRLEQGGAYQIIATHYIPDDGTPASIGAYRLELEWVDPQAAGVSSIVIPMQAGETIENSVSDEQYLLFYSFEGRSGDLVTIEVQTTSGDLDPVLYLYTYTSAGGPIEIFRNDDSPRGGTYDPLIENLPLPRNGTYLIAVGRFPDGTSTGDFEMSLRVNVPGPTPLPEGTPSG
jgi:hypothetical protein